MTAEIFPYPTQIRDTPTTKRLRLVPEQSIGFNISDLVKKVPEKIANGVTVLVNIYEQSGEIVPEDRDDAKIIEKRFAVLDRINLANLCYRDEFLDLNTGRPNMNKVRELEDQTTCDTATSQVLQIIKDLKKRLASSPAYTEALEISEILTRILAQNVRGNIRFE